MLYPIVKVWNIKGLRHLATKIWGLEKRTCGVIIVQLLNNLELFHLDFKEKKGLLLSWPRLNDRGEKKWSKIIVCLSCIVSVISFQQVVCNLMWFTLYCVHYIHYAKTITQINSWIPTTIMNGLTGLTIFSQSTLIQEKQQLFSAHASVGY